jgi:hypothetical protein
VISRVSLRLEPSCTAPFIVTTTSIDRNVSSNMEDDIHEKGEAKQWKNNDVRYYHWYIDRESRSYTGGHLLFELILQRALIILEPLYSLALVGA